MQRGLTGDAARRLHRLTRRHERTVTRVTAAPGPGEYALPSTLAGPAFKIGTRLRGSRQAELVPGPAEYQDASSTLGAAVAVESGR